MDSLNDWSSVVAKAREKVQSQWAAVDDIERHNVQRVLQAFHRQQIGDQHFAGSTGYGSNDAGRDALEAVFADVFGTEAALVRPLIASGTHAISASLFGLLQPGDHIVSAAGAPYDTLQQVITGDRPTSLKHYGVTYSEAPLAEDGDVDIDAVVAALRPETRVVLIQRSRGYTWRPALSVARIGDVIKAVKEKRPDVICFIDNCYGEFVEPFEPSHAGADLMAGSLIKNAGGGIAPAGGYIVGKAELVERAADRITAPGLGAKLGPMIHGSRDFFFGLFQSPSVVAEALRGAMLTAQLFHDLGYDVSPRPDEARADVVQAIRLSGPEELLTFCRAVQSAGPVDSYVTPVPGPVPGYEDPVVMAGGTFIQGSSIEWSADGPMREPYTVFVQGGLHREHVHVGLTIVLETLDKAGYIQQSANTY